MSSPPNDQRPIPHAGRPRGQAWRDLQREGVEWEGQVLIGADEHVLSARLIITSQRLAFARGGEVVLDIARWWLKRPPFLSGNGAVNLRIETGSGARDRLQFSARDGRQSAAEIVTLLVHGKQALPSVPLDPVFTDLPQRRSYAPDLTREPAPDQPPHKLSDEHKYTTDVIDATTLQVLDTTDFPPVTETQTPSTHHEAAGDAGRVSSEPITISTLANQTHRAGEWSLNPIPSLSPRSDKGMKAGWAFRLSGLVILIALAAAFGSSRLPDTSRLTNRNNPIVAPNGAVTPTGPSVAQAVPTATLAIIATNEPTRQAAETAVSLGVGGETIESSSFPATASPTTTETATTEPTATATATIDPTDVAAPDLSGADMPTNTPAAEPTATETATAEPTATEMPTTVPTATDTATKEPPATETATTEPAAAETETAEPTITATATIPFNTPTVPAEASTETPVPVDTPTTEPTGVPTAFDTAPASATETNTPEPAPTAGFPAQGRTVSEDTPPDQVFSTGPFRYTLEYSERGVEIPALELPAINAGEWVVIVLYAQNWSTEPATLNMADFQLLVSGDFGYQFVGLDTSSPDISRFLGFDPVLETTELTSIEPGKGIRLALVYVVPPATTDVELIDDTSGLNIAPSLALGGDVTNLGPAPTAPDLLSATVTEVIDGNTIVVEADGQTATIRYLGVTVPVGTECYAAEATSTNTDIVLGKTVYLEREFRNRASSEDNIFARDVWIDNQQGGLVLVSAWLASEGAAVPAPDSRDTRFAGWIQAAADSAEGNGLGFWAACGGPPVSGQTRGLSSLT